MPSSIGSWKLQRKQKDIDWNQLYQEAEWQKQELSSSSISTTLDMEPADVLREPAVISFANSWPVVGRVTRTFLLNIVEIFPKLLQVLAVQWIHQGNTMGNGLRVLWRITTPTDTHKLELCHSKCGQQMERLWEPQNLLLYSLNQTHWIRICIFTRSPL